MDECFFCSDIHFLVSRKTHRSWNPAEETLKCILRKQAALAKIFIIKGWSVFTSSSAWRQDFESVKM